MTPAAPIQAQTRKKHQKKRDLTMVDNFRLRFVPAAIVLAASMQGGETLGEEKTPSPPALAPNQEPAVYEGKTTEEWLNVLLELRKINSPTEQAAQLDRVHHAIIKIGGDTIPTLLKALDDNRYTKKDILDLFCAVKPTRKELPTFFRLLKNSNFEVRRVAIRILAPMAASELDARKAIQGMLQDRDKAVAEAAEAALNPSYLKDHATTDIVVPPDILAQAELGDHFETNNPEDGSKQVMPMSKVPNEKVSEGAVKSNVSDPTLANKQDVSAVEENPSSSYYAGKARERLQAGDKPGAAEMYRKAAEAAQRAGNSAEAQKYNQAAYGLNFKP